MGEVVDFFFGGGGGPAGEEVGGVTKAWGEVIVGVELATTKLHIILHSYIAVF